MPGTNEKACTGTPGGISCATATRHRACSGFGSRIDRCQWRSFISDDIHQSATAPAIMPGRNALMSRKGARALTAKVYSHSLQIIGNQRRDTHIQSVIDQQVNRAEYGLGARIRREMSPGLERSQRRSAPVCRPYGWKRPLRAPVPASRSTIMTLAPRKANARTVASPMPSCRTGHQGHSSGKLPSAQAENIHQVSC